MLPRGDLEAASALELMAEFHSQLGHGESPMESLRLARRNFAARRGNEFAVAGFFLLGPGHRPLINESSEEWLLPGVFYLAALAGGVALLIRRKYRSSTS